MTVKKKSLTSTWEVVSLIKTRFCIDDECDISAFHIFTNYSDLYNHRLIYFTHFNNFTSYNQSLTGYLRFGSKSRCLGFLWIDSSKWL